MFRGKWSWMVKGLEVRSFKKGCVWNKFKMQAVPNVSLLHLWEQQKMTLPSFIQLFILMQMNAWSYEVVSSKKQIKDNLKIEPSIKVYTNLAKALECAFKDQSELWWSLFRHHQLLWWLSKFKSLECNNIISLYWGLEKKIDYSSVQCSKFACPAPSLGHCLHWQCIRFS